MKTSRVSWPIAAILLVGAAAGGYAAKRHIAVGRLNGTLADTVVYADSALKTCRPLASDRQQACYEGMIMPLIRTRGVKVAMGTLHRIGDNDAAVRANSHVYAHGVGITAGKMGGNMSETFASCTEIYQSGCYHGVIQAYFETVSSVDSSSVNALCHAYAVAGGDRWLRFQCVHGMGHGLTMYYGHDMPRALQACDLLADSWDRESCFGGAFMENVVNATNPHHPASALHNDHHADGMAGMDMGHSSFKALDPDDKQYPCSIVGARYQTACYIMQSSVMLKYEHGDIAATARDCEQAPGRMKYFCHQSLGRDISALSRGDHREAIRMCSLANEEYQPWCHVGVVKDFVFLAAKADDGISYCRDVAGSRNKAACYEAVGQQIATLRNDTAERMRLCVPSEPQYQANCLFGAQAGGSSVGIPQARGD
jgi:hypothetical protein